MKLRFSPSFKSSAMFFSLHAILDNENWGYLRLVLFLLGWIGTQYLNRMALIRQCIKEESNLRLSASQWITWIRIFCRMSLDMIIMDNSKVHFDHLYLSTIDSRGDFSIPDFSYYLDQLH